MSINGIEITDVIVFPVKKRVESIMTSAYYTRRASEVISDPLLGPLVAMILQVPCADVKFYVENERETVKQQVIQYLKGE